MVRIVPSPDWFVGIDSLDLCEGGRWKEQVVLDLYPHDAGTDSGFTFSSPNFATIPQDTVTEVRAAALALPHRLQPLPTAQAALVSEVGGTKKVAGPLVRMLFTLKDRAKALTCPRWTPGHSSLWMLLRE